MRVAGGQWRVAATGRRTALRWVRLVSLAASVLLGPGFLVAVPASGLHFAKHRDLFFIEDNFVYSRCLNLSHDGNYRQIDRDRTGSTEVDRGTWEQAADETVALHSTYRGLRLRALRSGPLTMLLDSTAKVDALPQTGAAIRRLLERVPSDVFSAADAGETGALEAPITVDRGAESFRRNDLTNLAEQIAQTVQTERSRIYLLKPLRAPGGPILLVLQGTTYGPEQVAAVCREYQVPRGSPPPFYFAQTDAASFARRAGSWRELAPLGGPDAP